MTNKEKLTAALESVPKELQNELSYFLHDIVHEDEYDVTDAFDDVADFAENNDKRLFKLVQDIYIKVGYVVPIERHQVIWTNGRWYWFIRNGVHYQVEHSWESWISK